MLLSTRLRFLPIAVVAAATVATTVLPQAPAGAQAGDDSAALAEVMLTRLNEVRRDNGLAPYRTNPILTRIAFDHARDIAAHTMYSHTGSDGRKPKQRAIDAGYGAGRAGLRIGENFVARQHLDDGFQWLMDDPPHRANMLDPKYREVGVGAARMSYGYVWVMDLGWYEGVDEAPAAAPTALPPTETPTEVPTATPLPTATETTVPPTETPSPTVAPMTPTPAEGAGAAGGATAGPGGVVTTGPGGAATAAGPSSETAPGAGTAPPGAGGTGGDGGGAPGDAGDGSGGGGVPPWLWMAVVIAMGLGVAVWLMRRGR